MSLNINLLNDTEKIDSIFETRDIENRSFESIILENNMNLHHEMVEIDKNYYRSLIENINEGEEAARKIDFEKISNKINIMITYLINFINDMKRILTNSNIYRKQFYKTINRYKQLPSDKSLKRRFIILYNYCNLDDINTNDVIVSLENITDYIDKIIMGEDVANISSSVRESTFQKLATVLRRYSVRSKYRDAVDSVKSFKSFIATDMMFKEKKEMLITDWVDTFSNKQYMHQFNSRTLDRCLDPILDMLNNYKNKVSKEKKLNVSKETNKNLSLLLDDLKIVIYNYVWFVNYVYDKEYEYMKLIERVYNNIIGVNNESAFIHGEPFNSDTLFDNEDMRDFNPTEWLDLTLESCSYEIDYIINESYNRIALKEANILSDDEDSKFKRLLVMREAEEQNTEKQIDTVINSIDEAVSKFFNKLTAKSKSNLYFVNNNRAAVKARIKINEVKSKGDIIAGLYRVQNSINLVNFHNNMKQYMKDKSEFFKNYVIQTMNKESRFSKRKLEFNDGVTVAVFAKAYYGASMPDDKFKMCTFNGAELEQNKDNMIKFISNPISYLSSIKQDIKKLGDVTTKIYRQNSKFSNMVDNKNSNQNAQDAESSQTSTDTKQEAYYSELYNCFITEAEIKMDKPTFKEKKNDKIVEKANYHKVYLDCYKDIILAKITAIEFIINEFSQIIRAHAGTNANKTDKPVNDIKEQ